MGVTGLWKLIDSAGKQVTLESLEGKVLAVDASILLNQAILGMKDQPNAHLHVLFLRLCKLLTYKIKPIFVFDGGAPVLKRQTIAARQKRRDEARIQAQSVSERLKRKAVQRHAVDTVLGKASSTKILKTSEPDLFELPPLPQTLDDSAAGSDGYYELPIHSMLYSGDIDISQVDIHSEGFKSLPLEYQHEILEELKEHTKHSTASLSLAGAEKADTFSSFQIAKLVKSSKLTSKIENLRKEMLADFADHTADPNLSVIQANRVMSEDSTHYLLVNTSRSTPQSNTRDNQEAVADAVYDIGHTAISISSSTGRSPLSTTKFSEPIADLSESLSGDEDSYLLSADNQKMLLDSLSAEKAMECTDMNYAIKTGIKNSIETAAVSSESDDSSEIAEAKSTPVEPNTVSGLSELPKGGPDYDSADQQKLLHVIKTTVAPSMISQEETPFIVSQEETPHSVEKFSAQPCREITVQDVNIICDVEAVRSRGVAHDVDVVRGVDVQNVYVGAHCSKDVRSTPPSHSRGSPSLINASQPVHSVATIEMMEENVTGILHTDDEESDDDQGSSPTTALRTASDNPSIAGLANEVLEDDTKLDTLANELRMSQYYLNMDLQKHQLLSQTVTQQMVDDAVELLRLFGIPYVLSPSEAEAQCAKLEQLGLCNGIITEDSDVWLFGGSHVLKNFFQQDRHVTSFNAKDILRIFGLDKEKLIALALVCGSDYTDGILNAGPVTAIEIISEFGSKSDGISALKAFKTWVDSIKSNNGILPPNSANSAVRSKLRKLVNSVPDIFPNHVVVDAYQNPRVDDSNESFKWGKPDLDLLRQFAHKTLNWSKQRVDDLVCPVLKKLNSTETQSRLSSFFDVQATAINSSTEFQSRRLKSAISKLVSAPSVTVPQPTGAVNIDTKPPENVGKTRALPKTKVTGGRGRMRAGNKKAFKPPPKVNLGLVKDDISLSEESDD